VRANQSNFEVPNLSFQEVRKRYGGPNLSDEEILSPYDAGSEFVDALKTAPPRKEYLDGRKPLVSSTPSRGVLNLSTVSRLLFPSFRLYRHLDTVFQRYDGRTLSVTWMPAGVYPERSRRAGMTNFHYV
jgi:hypothetical protein